MTACVENDHHALFFDDVNKFPTSKNKFYHRWWCQDYEHQRFINGILEHHLFYKITITLLLLDCIFVISQTIIDFTKVKFECVRKSDWTVNQYKYEIEISMKFLHYSSISILTLFVVEFFLKIYVFGREFWNIHKRKMEYFDGLIVIFSYFIDIYFLQNENNYFMEYRFEMITTIRFWRIIRIMNSVAQCVISEEQKKKDRLNIQYIITIEQLLDLLKYKTNCIEKEHKNTEEDFTKIDNQCQYYLDLYKETTEQIPSSDAMTQFAEQLQMLKTSIAN